MSDKTAPCPTCDGHGELLTVAAPDGRHPTCSKCHGTGQAPAEAPVPYEHISGNSWSGKSSVVDTHYQPYDAAGNKYGEEKLTWHWRYSDKDMMSRCECSIGHNHKGDPTPPPATWEDWRKDHPGHPGTPATGEAKPTSTYIENGYPQGGERQQFVNYFPPAELSADKLTIGKASDNNYIAIPPDIRLCKWCWCQTHTVGGMLCGKCGKSKGEAKPTGTYLDDDIQGEMLEGADPLSERIDALIEDYGLALATDGKQGNGRGATRTAILALFREYAEAVIGADEPNFYGGLNYTNDKAARNSLRQEQRTRLESPEADHA